VSGSVVKTLSNAEDGTIVMGYNSEYQLTYGHV
jgi:hypothetical protein